MRSLGHVAVLAFVALIGTACGADSETTSTVATATTTTESSSATTAREAAPNLTGTTLQGETFALGDSHGRPVLINVWSSW